MAVQRRDISSAYRTGRFLARLIAALGWVVVGLAILALIGFVASYFAYSGGGAEIQQEGALLAAGIGSCLGVMLTGLVLVAIGQMLRATLDTADNTRQMLDIMQA
jgi:hypothetical protein